MFVIYVRNAALYYRYFMIIAFYGLQSLWEPVFFLSLHLDYVKSFIITLSLR